MRKAAKLVLALFLTYSLLLVGFFTAMCQKPAVFSTVMSKSPNLVFLVFPFRQMWIYARRGGVKVNDEAPDFSLETYDKKTRVQLSDARGKKPVVLVFGSYT